MGGGLWRLDQLVVPAILSIFLGLYLLGLLSGVEPELALLRAGLAGVLLAGLARLASAILESALLSGGPGAESEAGRHVDVAIGEADAASGERSGGGDGAARAGEG